LTRRYEQSDQIDDADDQHDKQLRGLIQGQQQHDDADRFKYLHPITPLKISKKQRRRRGFGNIWSLYLTRPSMSSS
jgi:hypothetical protein